MTSYRVASSSKHDGITQNNATANERFVYIWLNESATHHRNAEMSTYKVIVLSRVIQRLLVRPNIRPTTNFSQSRFRRTLALLLATRQRVLRRRLLLIRQYRQRRSRFPRVDISKGSTDVSYKAEHEFGVEGMFAVLGDDEGGEGAGEFVEIGVGSTFHREGIHVICPFDVVSW